LRDVPASSDGDGPGEGVWLIDASASEHHSKLLPVLGWHGVPSQHVFERPPPSWPDDLYADRASKPINVDEGAGIELVCTGYAYALEEDHVQNIVVLVVSQLHGLE
jgi:hypothetical protein